MNLCVFWCWQLWFITNTLFKVLKLVSRSTRWKPPTSAMVTNWVSAAVFICIGCLNQPMMMCGCALMSDKLAPELRMRSDHCQSWKQFYLWDKSFFKVYFRSPVDEENSISWMIDWGYYKGRGAGGCWDSGFSWGHYEKQYSGWWWKGWRLWLGEFVEI